MNATKKVHEVQPKAHRKDKHGRDIYKVDELRGSWNRDEEFKWTAPADSDITISFPEGHDPLKVGTNRLVPKGTFFSRRLKVIEASELSAVRLGKPYSYTIFIHTSQTYAECLSEPEVIIYE